MSRIGAEGQCKHSSRGVGEVAQQLKHGLAATNMGISGYLFPISMDFRLYFPRLIMAGWMQIIPVRTSGLAQHPTLVSISSCSPIQILEFAHIVS